MLGEFGLLVAPREGEYVAPERFRHAIRSLDPGNYDDCSSTRLRETIRHADDWREARSGVRSQIWWRRYTGELFARACVQERSQAMAAAGMTQLA